MKFPILISIAFALIAVINSIDACNPATKNYFQADKNGDARAVAILKGIFDGQPIVGKLTFLQNCEDSLLYIKGNITGLTNIQSKKHGLHVHERAITDISDDVNTRCMSSGGHFNPTNMNHGNILSTVRHVGDYGNVVADENGVININIIDNISGLYGPFGIIGRTIVLHELEDDLGLVDNAGSRTTGNAGKRIACGVIGIF